ncbi:uncharacterized protein F4812DRAFT_208699 [Daldinia caldariorum]|uniref:uncharacterized protein n=1 Tax=Daldinia caldariorum TaxID=326644 RepID=UPI002008DF66|nr:uncharacterized protein F4812DRAFT_208699 [Daldinia caldariorum]KAI1464358.1 hypothetical protein F4812DRAFT_208699 [Daldinia caldariorum]
MKLHSFLLPALAGIATTRAEDQLKNAEAYIIRQSKTTTSSNPPSIPNQLARAILLQRLSTSEHPAALGQLPESISQDESISYINQFAKTPAPLFEIANDANEPRQLVIALSGITTDKHNDLKAAIPRVPLAFTAPGLSGLPVRGKKSSCAFEQAIDSDNKKCWEGKTQYLEYDVTKNKNVITLLGKNVESLNAQAVAGKLDTTILLLAQPSAEAAAADDDELRRRAFKEEKVLAEVDDGLDDDWIDIPTADSTVSHPGANADKPFHAFGSGSGSSSDSKPGSSAAAVFSSKPLPVLPACFASQNACVTATDSCSGRGECVDRWGKVDGATRACFSCRCMATNETDARGRVGLYHWGGAACQKRDISTPFWLFAGVSVTLAATIAFAVGLLFSVGEEKLPGVIGAGVSRSTK